MNVLLTAPRVALVDIFTGLPPLALYQLASVLREAGHIVTVLDPASLDIRLSDGTPLVDPMLSKKHDGFLDDNDLAALEFVANGLEFVNLRAAAARADVVGISANSYQWRYAQVMMQHIRSVRPDVPIVVGGPHATHLPDEALAHSPADYAVRGDGERTFPALLAAIPDSDAVAQVPGVSFKRNGCVIHNPPARPIGAEDLERLPLPAFDLLPDGAYGSIGVESARGCRFACRFCSVPTIRTWRARNESGTRRAVRHALSFTYKLRPSPSGDHGLTFVDDNFTGDVARAEAILSWLSTADLAGWRLFFQARAHATLHSRIPQLLAAIPVASYEMGIESGSDVGMKRARKSLTVNVVVQCLEAMKAAGVAHAACLSFILGLPWDDPATLMKTVSFEQAVHARFGVAIQNSWYNLLPGSWIWDNRGQLGITVGHEAFESHFYLSESMLDRVTPGLTRDARWSVYEHLRSYWMLASLSGTNAVFRLPFAPSGGPASSHGSRAGELPCSVASSLD